jgi:small-conductance mechanosensitive channel
MDMTDAKTARERAIEKMFQTRTYAWEEAGLARQISARSVKRAKRDIVLLLPLIAAVIVAYSDRKRFFGVDEPIRIATVVLLVILGWAFARAVGRAIGPALFRRLSPETAGTVGFIVRLGTIAASVIVALRIAGLDPGTLAVGGALTAVVLGLAAQQTLGNLIAGMVLLSARPFRVGERVRLQAGAIGGTIEGVVSSLGLLYTTLARGEDRVMIPNGLVLNAAVVPLLEPDAVDLRARLRVGLKPSEVQALLHETISVPTRSEPHISLEELDGDEVIVRIQATPELARDGAKLADEILAAMALVTREHEAVPD